MIRSFLKRTNTVLLFLSGFMALCFLTAGMLSLWSSISTAERAFTSRDLIKYKPETEEDGSLDFDELEDLNPDVAAWLTIYGTNIDYPILQGRSDMEYINKDAFGNYAIPGSIFLSVMNRKDFSEPYQLIYGHNMENGSMFGDIDKFTDREFFYGEEYMGTDREEGILITKEKVYDLHVIYVLKTDAFDPMIYKADKSSDELNETLGYLRETAMYSKDADDASHIVALSTCYGGTSYGRLVLICKAAGRTDPIPVNESEKHSEKISALGHPEIRGQFALLDLMVLMLGLYMACPLHLIGRIGQRDHLGHCIACLSLSAVSLAAFIFTEDIAGSFTVAGRRTPIFIVMTYIIWKIRYHECLKAEQYHR